MIRFYVKTIHIILFLILVCPYSYSQNQKQTIEFNISGKTRPDLNGRTALLLFMNTEESGAIRVETSRIEDGKFSFNGQIKITDMFDAQQIASNTFTVSIDHYSSNDIIEYCINGYLEEGNINIVLDSVSHISGTPQNDIFEVYHEISRKPFSKSYVNFIKENIDNHFGIRAFRSVYQQLSDYDVNDILSIANDDFKNNEDVTICLDGREILKSIEKESKQRVEIKGTKCPDFGMITSDGKEVRLYDYIGKSKYLVIDFWASWCGPCIASMPYMKTVTDMYKDKGVSIIGISLDEGDHKQAWLKAVKKIDMPWEQLSDLKGYHSELAKSFAVSDVPYTVLLDDKGTILECVRIPTLHLETILEKLP